MGMTMRWTIDQIVRATAGRLVYGPPDLAFEGIGIDSRTIAPDRLFVAIRGEHHDGHAFIDQVLAKGVKGFVAAESALAGDRPAGDAACIAVTDTTRALGDLAAFQRNRADIPVVAITGSNGKTSTRRMTALIMQQRFNTLSAQGNFNNEIGLPLTLFDLTPEHQVAVLELGMNHPGEIARLGAICRPTIGVITTVGPAHLEFLGSLEGVARAKAELLDRIDPGGTAVLNLDDPHVKAMAPACSRPVLFFGTCEGAAVRARNIRDAVSGVAFDLELPGETLAVQLRTPGRFMVANALAAAAAGHLAGVSAMQIKAGLEAFRPDKGRLHVVTTAHGVNIIDDTYNANPASMAAAFETLAALRQDRPGIIVVGDMLELGSQAEALHRRTGARAAASGAARLYACGRHAEAVGQGAREAGMAPEAVFTGTKEAIVDDLLPRLAPGHWLLVKGSRGMAMETVVAAVCRRGVLNRTAEVDAGAQGNN